MSEILNKAAETAASAIMRFKAKTAGRYYPGYHEDMRDAVKKAILAERASLSSELDRLREAIIDACDLLMERKHGSPARSPSHNARLRMEEAIGHWNGRALSPDNSTQKKEGEA